MRNYVQPRSIRVLTLVEAARVTSPAKNLLEFCRLQRTAGSGTGVVTSIALFVRGEENNDFLDAAASVGVELHPITERHAFDLRVIKQLRKLVANLAPDIIETHHVKSHFLVRISGLWRQYPWVAFHHGYTADAVRTRIYNELDRWSLRVPAQIVTVCRAFKRQLAARGAPDSRITVLSNDIPIDWMNGGSNHQPPHLLWNASKADDERIVLAVGRLSPEKAICDLVAAVHELRRQQPQLRVRLMVLGEGDDKKRIEHTVRALGLNDRVSLIGHVRDVRPYYGVADVFALSSVSEGAPNAVLEAMAAGVPIVATAVGGIPELVSDKNTALLTQPRDAAGMAAAIGLLLSQPDLSRQLAVAAKELVKQKYSPQRRAQALRELYTQVADNARNS